MIHLDMFSTLISDSKNMSCNFTRWLITLRTAAFMNNHKPGMCIPKIQEIFPPRQLSYSSLKIIQHIQIASV